MILSSRALENAIATNSLQPSDKAKYLVFAVLFGGVAWPFYLIAPLFGKEPGSILNEVASVALTVAALAIIYGGIRRCFRTNEAIDNHDFTERFILLYLPLSLRFFAAVFALSVGATIVIRHLRDSYPAQDRELYVYFNVSYLVATYLFYSLLNRSFARLGRRINDRDLARR